MSAIPAAGLVLLDESGALTNMVRRHAWSAWRALGVAPSPRQAIALNRGQLRADLNAQTSRAAAAVSSVEAVARPGS